ncbi:c-type cytochrome [Inquilinus limosus]|uniref:c-type cytochrome n=1 Tax=Inquilinus limosus TaxID=171674 RepID=UPI003F5CCA44
MPSGRGRGVAAVLATAAMAVLAACGGRRAAPQPASEPRTSPGARRLRRALAWIVPVLAMILLLGGGAAVYGIQSRQAAERWAADLTGGDPQRAPALILRNGCAGCHTIPGIDAARGTVGPALSGLADRAYIGGVLPNTPENLVLWLRDSRAVNPRTAMPSTRIPEAEARDIAAYLYAHGTRP